MVLTQSDRGRTVQASEGSVVTVRLPENPSTGYRWAVESSGGLDPAGDRTEPGEAIGTAGTRELNFRASPRGTHELRMKNWRSWEGDASVRERFDITVVVT